MQQRMLAGVQVADVMTPNPVTAAPDLSVQQFIDDYLCRTRFSTMPLLDHADRLVGPVTSNRIREVSAADRPGTRLLDVACPPSEVPIAGPEEPLIRVAAEDDWLHRRPCRGARHRGASDRDRVTVGHGAEFRSRAGAVPH